MMNQYDYYIAGLVTCLVGIVFLFHLTNAKKNSLEAKKRRDVGEPESFRSIKVAIDSKVAIITLDRPRKKNAFSKLMYREVERAIRTASADTAATVIMLIGVGDYYSSGNDLSNFSELKHPLTIAKEAREVLFSFVDSFITCQKPIIVAVNGPAIG
jgi:Delta3-Delta2-enoyl-CoA isomerase